MKMEGSSTPSSSSNHVVLERLNGAKGDKKLEAGDLPSLGEDDIHNVIGSCNYYRDDLMRLIIYWWWLNDVEY